MVKGLVKHQVSNMVSKVAVVELGENVQKSFRQAVDLTGGIDDLNTAERPVVIKVGVFDHKKVTPSGCATVGMVRSIADAFNRAPQVSLIESDNYKGTGLERLQIWHEVFNERVVPFNLSTDTDTRKVKVGKEEVGFSRILFKPNIFVSTHVPRRFDNGGLPELMNVGSVLKNLLGLIPDRKKARFHKNLVSVLLDAYEAIGGIDLAVLDGTYTYLSTNKTSKRLGTNILLVGRDSIAVEAVGASLVDLDPERMPLIQEAVRRGLGEGDLSKIEVLGTQLETVRRRFQDARLSLGLQ